MSDDEVIFRIVFFVLFSAVMLARAVFGWRNRCRGESSWAAGEEGVEREGRWGVFLRVGMFFYMLAAVALYAIYPAWLGSLAISLPDWARWLGVAIGILSLGLLIWVHAVLGRHWNTNLRLQEGHRLVTTGPYRRVRHPMYSALIGVFSGLALIAANWLMVPLLLGSAYALVRRVGKEEAMMIAVFGDEYRDYMRRSGRFLPPLK